MPYKLFLTGQASRSSPWPQIVEIRTFFSQLFFTIFQGRNSKMGFGARSARPAPDNSRLDAAPGGRQGPQGPQGGPGPQGPPWGPPWGPVRCAAGMREAHFTLVYTRSISMYNDLSRPLVLHSWSRCIQPNRPRTLHPLIPVVLPRQA